MLTDTVNKSGICVRHNDAGMTKPQMIWGREGEEECTWCLSLAFVPGLVPWGEALGGYKVINEITVFNKTTIKQQAQRSITLKPC